ncbi:GDSL esterase/lipase At3g48460 [Aristolochia californica]|uniref:GDSL esterase/lipase At3g48460 n=1 Tax=Aristolochia californica TaxID=171875 RepID=UPI0035DE127D
MVSLDYPAFHLLVTTFSLLFLSASPSSPFSSLYAGQFSKIYAFGDSYTDTGNTRSHTGPSGYAHVSNLPYGMTFFHHPTNRYSDGRLLVDFLADALSLPFLPPYLDRTTDSAHGVNFAVAGATAIDHEFFVRNNVPLAITPQSLSTELGWFDGLMEKKGCGKVASVECDSAMKNALFWVGEIGANDYAYTAVSSVTNSTVQRLAVNTTLTFLQALIKRGAKSMVVQGLPMLGCLPLSLYLAPPDDRDSIGCVASMNRVARDHNARLLSGVRTLRQSHPSVTISYADFWNAHRAVVSSPAKYGIREPFKTCCGTGGGPYNFQAFATCGAPDASKACAEPSEYVNWDGVHLTEGMNAVLAELFLRGGYMDPPFTRLLRNKRVRV